MSLVRVQFTGPVPAAPPGVLLFQPDEVRAVGAVEADYLCRNAQFVRLEAAATDVPAPQPEEAAPTVEAAPDPTPAPDPAPFVMEG